MHGEDLVVQVWAEQMVFRTRQLQSHECGEQASENEEAECGDDEAQADALVVH
jgi:hypothetical protein